MRIKEIVCNLVNESCGTALLRNLCKKKAMEVKNLNFPLNLSLEDSGHRDVHIFLRLQVCFSGLVC